MYYTKQEEQKARIKSAMIVVGILCVTFFVMALFISFSNDKDLEFKQKSVVYIRYPEDISNETIRFVEYRGYEETSASTDLNETKECIETVQGSKKTIRCES